MFLREQKSKLTNLRFLYSQDLSNCTTKLLIFSISYMFLYSQDLSNCTTDAAKCKAQLEFLYSQALSDCATAIQLIDLLLL